MSPFPTFVGVFAVLACAVSAHMGLSPSKAVAGSRTIVSLRIGHDCGDDTIGTTNFTVELPPRLSSVSVEQMPHWRAYIHKAPADPPIDTGHGIAAEYVSHVTYIGFLPDGFYQIFNLRIGIPSEVGKTLWFKGYQDCHNQGTSIAWATIPSEEDPDPRYPARGLAVLEKPPSSA